MSKCNGMCVCGAISLFGEFSFDSVSQKLNATQKMPQIIVTKEFSPHIQRLETEIEMPRNDFFFFFVVVRNFENQNKPWPLL